MKKFKFRLEKLLTLKKAQEQMKFIELAPRIQLKNKYEGFIASGLRVKNSYLENNISSLNLDNIDHLRNTYEYLNLQNAQVLLYKKKLQEIRNELEPDLKELLNLKKARRSLELLKEKALQEYNKELTKQEFTELDDFNTAKFELNKKEKKGDYANHKV